MTAPAPRRSCCTPPGYTDPPPSTPPNSRTTGNPGPGRWITIYANSAHAWIVIAGIALDTADYGGPPIPSDQGYAGAQPLANLNDGTAYVVRHPAGL